MTKILGKYNIGRKKVIIALVCIFVFGAIAINSSASFTTNHSPKPTRTMTTSLPELKKMFGDMEHEAKWNTKEPLYYGYYFYDRDKDKLEKFSRKLHKKGLQTYQIEKSTAFMSNQYLLYAFEYVVKTPESLLERCTTLSKLAIDNHIEEFDGWESGPEPLGGNKHY